MCVLTVVGKSEWIGECVRLLRGRTCGVFDMVQSGQTNVIQRDVVSSAIAVHRSPMSP